jgi:DnaK suppressor protein
MEAMEQKLILRLREVDEALRHSADALEPVKLDQTSVGRLSRMDALQQQAMRAGLRDAQLRQRRRIEAALARIREDVYGVCCSCGDDLPAERLQADPAAPFCVACEAEISQTKRPR